jgi:hypothetical protein
MNAIELIKIDTPELRQKVTQLAEADAHDCSDANYAIARNGEIIGSLNLPTVTAVGIWLDSKEAKIQDSVAVAHIIRGMMSAMGYRKYAIPCAKESPLYPYLEKAGYQRAQDCTIFVTKPDQPKKGQ